MVNLNFPGVDIATLLSQGYQKDVVRQSRYMASSQGWRSPNGFYTPAGASQHGIYEQVWFSDEYWTWGHRFLVQNFIRTSGNTAESDNTDTLLIEGQSVVFTDVNGVVQTIPLTFGGASTYSISGGSFIWSDTLAYFIPPNAKCLIRTAHYAAGARPTSTLGYSKSAGERYEVSATSLAAKLTAGGISTALPGGNDIFPLGVSACVAQGWDGRPVPMILGTSIEFGQGESRHWRNSFNEVGPIGRGLSSKANGAQRLPNMNVSVPGAKLQAITGTTVGLGLYRFKQTIDALGLALPPWTSIISALGTNDAAAFSAWLAAFTTAWAAIKAAWPSSPLIQTTMLPRTTSTDAFQTVANQTFTSGFAYPASAWSVLNEMIKGNPLGSGLDGSIDLNDYWDNSPNGGVRGKFRVDAMDPWTGALQAASAVSALTVSLDSIPPAGGVLAFVTDNPECGVPYNYAGTSPYSVNVISSLTGTHASAGAVKLSNTIDGTHPSGLLNQKVADDGWSKMKIAGKVM